MKKALLFIGLIGLNFESFAVISLSLPKKDGYNRSIHKVRLDSNRSDQRTVSENGQNHIQKPKKNKKMQNYKVRLNLFKNDIYQIMYESIDQLERERQNSLSRLELEIDAGISEILQKLSAKAPKIAGDKSDDTLNNQADAKQTEESTSDSQFQAIIDRCEPHIDEMATLCAQSVNTYHQIQKSDNSKSLSVSRFMEKLDQLENAVQKLKSDFQNIDIIQSVMSHNDSEGEMG